LAHTIRNDRLDLIIKDLKTGVDDVTRITTFIPSPSDMWEILFNSKRIQEAPGLHSKEGSAVKLDKRSAEPRGEPR
jgi:hypothetical protein